MEKNRTQLAISKKVLLSAYVIVPVLLVVAISDQLYFNSTLKPYMGVESLLLPLFIFIFNFPHIIASFFSFADHEYVAHYRKHLFIYLPLLLIGTAVLLYVDYVLGLLFYLINDVWHGVKQKSGIALILGAKPGKIYKLWMLVPFIASSLAFVYYLRPTIYPDFLSAQLVNILTVAAVLILVSMVLMIKTSAPKVRFYIFLVSSFFLASYYFVLAGYIFFAVLAFRFVHDVSAFAFYITHDHNRNLGEKKNWFYKVTSLIPLPIILLTPILAFAFAYLLRSVTGGIAIGYSVIILISMCHFYLESVMWKRNSPHRKHVLVE